MTLRHIHIPLTISLVFALVVCCDSVDPEDNDQNGPGDSTDPVARSAYWAPAWHPSGEFIGFNHTPMTGIHFPWGDSYPGVYEFDADSTGFWLINSDGSDMRRIFPHLLDGHAWSPDGNWMAFMSRGQIFKMPFNGAGFDASSIIQLTFNADNYNPAWSPDGEWIAYDSNAESTTGACYIWKMRADGSEKTWIGYSARGETKKPQWSPSEQRIVFSHYPGPDPDPEIFTMSITGSSWQRLTSNDIDNRNPAYRFDGYRIVYVAIFRHTPVSVQLWMMSLSGGMKHRVTSHNILASYSPAFSWNPRGYEIVYTRYKSREWTIENGVLWIINTSNGKKRQLTFNNVSEP